jgi:hypothetical protein
MRRAGGNPENSPIGSIRTNSCARKNTDKWDQPGISGSPPARRLRGDDSFWVDWNIKV